jgi:hypothetical protein
MRRLLTLTCVLVLVPAALAVASRDPSPTESAALRQAVRNSSMVPAQIRQGEFRLLQAQVSTRGPWAVATIKPTGPLQDRLDSVTALFHHGRAGWQVASLGTAGVGCGHPRPPAAVRGDLGISCPN